MRKEAGLEIDDRIDLQLAPPPDPQVAAAVENFGEYIREETLAPSLEVTAAPEGTFRQKANVGEGAFVVALRRVGD